MPLIDTTKSNPRDFTPEEQAELDAAAQEQEAQQPEETTEEPEQPEAEDSAPKANGKAQEPAQDATKPGTKPPTGFVPQQAVHELRQELKEERATRQRMEQTFQELLKRVGAPQTPAQPNGQAAPVTIPPYEQDPIGNLNARLEQALQQVQALSGQQQQQTQLTQQQAQYNAVVQQYVADAQSFSRETGDFNDAYQWLAASAESEVAARFPWMSAQQRQKVLADEEMTIISGALQNGVRPAEAIYNLAKHRGWKKAQPQPQENKIEKLQKGAKAAASLSSTKGAAPEGDGSLSLEALAALSGEEFDRKWEQMRKKGMLG